MKTGETETKKSIVLAQVQLRHVIIITALFFLTNYDGDTKREQWSAHHQNELFLYYFL
ncbi:hypothetical protein [Brevibacillus migulae]|uniref:hypothetical protein n=1 Tax=Brevibacillus migulae TaxID=1644114 RepID=UPI0014305444|nr:hypothetical protein [Brevibacillus migulae]